MMTTLEAVERARNLGLTDKGMILYVVVQGFAAQGAPVDYVRIAALLGWSEALTEAVAREVGLALDADSRTREVLDRARLPGVVPTG